MTKAKENTENSGDSEEVAEAAEQISDPDPIVVYDNVQVHRQVLKKKTVPMCEFKAAFPPRNGQTIMVRLSNGVRYEGVCKEVVQIGETVCVTFEEGLNPA